MLCDHTLRSVNGAVTAVIVVGAVDIVTAVVVVIIIVAVVVVIDVGVVVQFLLFFINTGIDYGLVSLVVLLFLLLLWQILPPIFAHQTHKYTQSTFVANDFNIPNRRACVQ